MDADLTCVKSFGVSVSIPTTIEEDGETRELSEKEVEKAGEALAAELEELNFAELLKGLGQSVAEEQFFKFRPVVDVTEGL